MDLNAQYLLDLTSHADDKVYILSHNKMAARFRGLWGKVSTFPRWFWALYSHFTFVIMALFPTLADHKLLVSHTWCCILAGDSCNLIYFEYQDAHSWHVLKDYLSVGKSSNTLDTSSLQSAFYSPLASSTFATTRWLVGLGRRLVVTTWPVHN